MSSSMGSVTISLDTTTSFYAQDFKMYDSSKAAVNMLGVNYARVLADKEAYVNVICPGLVATSLTSCEYIPKCYYFFARRRLRITLLTFNPFPLSKIQHTASLQKLEPRGLWSSQL